MKWKAHLVIFISIFLLFFYYIINYKNMYYIQYDIKVVQNDSIWLGEFFYSNSDSYHPDHRKETRYKKNTYSFQRITETIKNVKPIHRLRFDPLLGSGRVEIKNFTIRSINARYQNITKEYQVDFTKISNNYKHNLKIISANTSGAILESTGDDPFIEIANNIDFNTLNVHNTQLALIYALLLYLFIIIVKRYSLIKVLSFGILGIYTCYVLLFDSNIMAFNLMVSFMIASLLIVISNNPSSLLNYLKPIGLFLFLYLLIGYLSLYITTEVAYPNYFYKTIPYVTLALILPVGFYNIKKFDILFFKRMLTILLVTLATIIILLNQKFFSVAYYIFYDFLFKSTFWTQKNYAFWYLILMFSTLAFYDIRKKNEFIIILGIIVLSYFTIFSGYSASAKLAYAIGIVAYSLLSFFHIQKRYLLILSWIFTLYIIFSPILFSFMDLSSNPKLEERIAIYKTAFTLIKEHWLFGYGYGSTLTVNIKDFISVIDLPKNYIDTFPGGHPHNVALLFWLEFGIIGATFLAYYIHKLLVYIIENTYNYTNQAAVISMVVAFAIITSFSWSIWWPAVLLTFSFFGIMLTLSMNIKSLKIKPVKT